MSSDPTGRLTRGEELTPKERRSTAKAQASRLVARQRVLLGLRQADVGEDCGVSESRVGHWEDAHHNALPTLADLVYLMPAALADELLAVYAEHRGRAIVELPFAKESADDLRRAADAQRETAEAIAKLLHVLADGHITRAEGAVLEREVREAIACLLAILVRAQQAQREGIVGTTGFDLIPGAAE